MRLLLFLSFPRVFKRSWILYRHVTSPCFSVFFFNQFCKIISSDLSFARPHKQFNFLFSFLKTPVCHYTIASSQSLKKKPTNQTTKKHTHHFSYPCLVFEALVQGPLLSKRLSFHCEVSASVSVNNRCWFSAPIEIMIVTAEKWLIWATISLPTNCLAEKKKKKPRSSHSGSETWHSTKMGLFLLHDTLPVRRTMARLDHCLKHVVHEE